MYARKLMCHCYRYFAEVIKKELNSSNTNVTTTATTQAIPLTYLKLQNTTSPHFQFLC